MTHTSFVTPEMILRSVKIFHLIDLDLGSDFDWWRERTWTLQIFRVDISMLLWHATTGAAGKNRRRASARAFRSAIYGSTRWAFWPAFSLTRKYRRRRFNFFEYVLQQDDFLWRSSQTPQRCIDIWLQLLIDELCRSRQSRGAHLFI